MKVTICVMNNIFHKTGYLKTRRFKNKEKADKFVNKLGNNKFVWEVLL